MSTLNATRPVAPFTPAVADVPRAAVIVPPAGGTPLDAFGGTLVVKLGADATGGVLTLGLNTVPPGAGAPMHRHLAEDEIFIVVEGALEIFADGRWHAAPAGAVAFLPRGGVHTFRNAGDVPARTWLIATPGGFDRFFAECADVFAAAAAGAGPDMARILEIFAAHRIEMAA